MQQTRERIAVWFAGGVPSRIVWGGARYRVSDRPTPLEDSLFGLTHIPPHLKGWRFQGTAVDHSSRMFDIRQDGDDWVLVRSYD